MNTDLLALTLTLSPEERESRIIAIGKSFHNSCRFVKFASNNLLSSVPIGGFNCIVLAAKITHDEKVHSMAFGDKRPTNFVATPYLWLANFGQAAAPGCLQDFLRKPFV